MTSLGVAVLVATAVVLAGTDSAQRLAALQPPAGVSPPSPRAVRTRSPHRSVIASAVVALAVAGALGGASGVVLGAVAGAAAASSMTRADSAAERSRQVRLRRDLPIACDLLAACVAAGVSPLLALDEVAGAVPGPLGLVLAGVSRGAQVGLPPDAAWSPYLDGAPPELRTLAAVLARSDASGSSPARTLDALAVDLRERRRLDGEAAARRAGVLMVAPLGLCFLPAFVVLGVVPMVAGLVRGGLGFMQ